MKRNLFILFIVWLILSLIIGIVSYLVYPTWVIYLLAPVAGAAALALLDNLGGALGFIEAVTGKNDSQTYQYRNYPRLRANLLQNVRATWIEGVLEKSLSEAIRITLGLEMRPQAVSRRTLQVAGQEEETAVPKDKPIEEIFTEAGGKLLILGAPGAGKTMLLLELAKALVAQAEADETAPLPFVFNLSSWALEKKPLAEWLAEEMHQQYQLSRAASRQMVATEPLVLLLDGLDEVRAEARPDCVAAINAFQADHEVEIVVCSRIGEYEVLEGALNVATAVSILPLTDEQVDEFVSREGLTLTAVRATLQKDKPLRELTQTPFFLNIIALAYQGMTLADLQSLATVAVRRQHLFQAYVQRTFNHRPLSSDTPYTQPQAHHWLTQLAVGMDSHKQSILYLEHLQPTWLPAISRKWYRLFFRLLGGVLGGMILGTLGGLMLGVMSGLISGSVGGLLGGLMSGMKDKLGDKIMLTEEIRWTCPMNLLWLRNALLFGLITGLMFGLLGGLMSGLMFGLMFGLLLGLMLGFNNCTKIQEIRLRTQPNQGLQLSRNNALKMSLALWLSVGLLLGLSIGWQWSLSAGLIMGLLMGLMFGLMFGLFRYGGTAVIQHYTLRYLLYRANILPYPFADKKLIAFLDAMAERLILRRVGGGWIFIHRTLLEYFAELTPEDVSQMADNQ